MDFFDAPFVPHQSYSFQYPSIEGGTAFRRMTFECLAARCGSQMIVGIDLDSGHEGRWLPSLMTDVQPYEPTLVPQRFYSVDFKGRAVRLFVFSVTPSGDDYRVTGKINGAFVSVWQSELTNIQGQKRAVPQ